MYAIIEQGGKQLQVEKGGTYRFERVPGNKGDKVSLKEVLLIADGKKRHIGTPYVKKAEVIGTIINEVKDKKVISFKFKRRKSSRRKIGHRQKYTLVEVTDIKI